MKKLLFTVLTLLIALASALPVQAQDIKGDARGRTKVTVRRLPRHQRLSYRVSSDLPVPKLSGQGAGYLSAALHAYKSGGARERKHPSHAHAGRIPE